MEIPDFACALQSACIPAATGIPCNHWIPDNPRLGTATAKPPPNLLRLPVDSFRDVMVPGRTQGAPRPSEMFARLDRKDSNFEPDPRLAIALAKAARPAAPAGPWSGRKPHPIDHPPAVCSHPCPAAGLHHFQADEFLRSAGDRCQVAADRRDQLAGEPVFVSPKPRFPMARAPWPPTRRLGR